MSLVLPTDVEGVSTSRALGRAAIWVSSVFLAATFLLVIGFGLEIPQADVALAIAGLAIAGLAVAWALLASNPWLVFGLMLVAGAGIFLFTLQISAGVGDGWRSDAAIFTMPKIAITVVGIAGRSLPASIARSTVGFVVASLAVQFGTRIHGLVFAFDIPSIVTWLGIVLLLATLWYGRARATRGVRTMQVAAEVEERISERGRIAAEASAALHDTVLNDLQALAVSAPGRLLEDHRAFLVKDIASLAHPGLLVDDVMVRSQAGAEALRSSGLGTVIRSAREAGLRVSVSGDPALLRELEAPVLREVVYVVGRGLATVRRHSGVTSAEVSVAAGAGSVNIIVSDAGRGFDPRLPGTHSADVSEAVRRRVEAVHGTILVWSAPGSGTALLLSVPRSECPVGR
ncbi:hypothetical protein C5B96_09750 [Subtercola sp. Z020]|uniref:sensor histidine kinase n=1 Tax=Subtercola sp. Z020 TaxID=2080582 RepID=UPI000CE79EB4|nr:hypothetical protein [Subtercola sp. Z020]PPF82227.1 hypothetical protein C5B96_09750 [Subtercola sp. Z020]